MFFCTDCKLLMKMSFILRNISSTYNEGKQFTIHHIIFQIQYWTYSNVTIQIRKPNLMLCPIPWLAVYWLVCCIFNLSADHNVYFISLLPVQWVSSANLCMHCKVKSHTLAHHAPTKTKSVRTQLHAMLRLNAWVTHCQQEDKWSIVPFIMFINWVAGHSHP